jgi:hypothetical protein
VLRTIGGALAGAVMWLVVVSLLNLGLRHGWPDYAAVEKAMAFTLPMMEARLSMSAVSSLIGGLMAAMIGRNRSAALGSGIILLLFFIPIHYMLLNKFPLWYHLTFLISLPVLGAIGGMFSRARPATA